MSYPSVQQTAARPMVRFPFPLSDGSFAWLDLPGDGLREAEAVRLSTFVEALCSPGPTATLTEQAPMADERGA